MAHEERDQNFARYGVALIINLGLVQGRAALGSDGPENQVRMVRGS